MSELEKAFKKARKAWRADKEDKALKKAFKDAKAAFEKGGDAMPAKEDKKSNKKDKKSNKKRKADDDEDNSPQKKNKAETPKKEADLTSLEKALKAARKAKKADASPANKKAFKAAKKALDDAKASTGSKDVEDEKETEKEAEPEPEAEDDGLAGLKKGGAAAEESWDTDKSWETKKDDWGAKKDDWGAKKEKKEPNTEPSVKLFCGNLSFDVDDDAIREFFKDCGSLVDIYWLTHKDTGNFKGCGFVTFSTLDEAIKAMDKNGTQFMGRDLTMDYAKARENSGSKGGGGKGGKGKKELGEKPEGCMTVFCGNLPYDIDDEKMQAFATEAGCGELKKIRWLTDRESGEFKGVGFVDFWDTADVDKFIKRNGDDIGGRSVRLDYSAPREKKW